MRARLTAVVLTLIPVALFRDALFGGRVFFERDVHLQWYAQAATLGRLLAAGEPPLWSPYGGFGQPLLANPNNQAAYPLSLLLALMDPAVYYTLYVVLHVAIAGCGAAVLARKMDLGHGASLVSGAVYASSGPVLSTVSLWNHLAGVAWMPWAWAATLALLRRPSARAAGAWGVTLALPVLGGSPESALLSGLGSVALLIAGARPALAASSIRVWRCAALAVALAAGLAAVQWLPSLDLLRHSARRDFSPRERAYWSTFPATLPFTLVPAPIHAVPLEPSWRARFLEREGPYLKSQYLGLCALGLVAAALVAPRRPWRRCLVVTALGALVLALGRHTPIYEVAVALLPPLGYLRFPSKALFVVALCWALLAGMGWEALRQISGRRLVLPTLLFGLAVLAAVATAWLTGPGAASLAPFLQVPSGVMPAQALAAVHSAVLPAAMFGAVGLAVGASAATRRGRALAGPLAGGLALLAVVDLYAAHRRLNPTLPRALYASPPSWLAASADERGRRVYVYDYFQFPLKSRQYLGADTPPLRPLGPGASPGLAYMSALREYGVPTTLGAWQVEGSYDFDLLGLHSPAAVALERYLRDVEHRPVHLRLLRMAGIGLVVALHEQGFEDLLPVTRLEGPFASPIRLFRVPDPLPRHYVVEGVRTGSGGLSGLADPSFDPEREVLLEGAPSREAAPQFEAHARLLERRAARLRFEVEANRPGHLVVLDGFDPGWRATVDGTPAPVLRANQVFRAVPLGAGRHSVELRYAPAAIPIGVGTSVVSLGGLLLAVRRRAADIR